MHEGKVMKTPKTPKYGIPKEVYVGKHTYPVKIVEKVDAQDNQGEVTTGKQIRLKHQKAEAMRIAFIHEFAHAILDEVTASDLLSSDLEEIIVDNIAKYFEPFMKRR